MSGPGVTAAPGASASEKARLLSLESSRNRVGLLANRGAASSYGGGTYFATDDNGGTLYSSDGTNWTVASPRGISLGYQERTSQLPSLSNTTYADVTGLSLTFTPRSAPVWLEAYLPFLASIGSGGTYNNVSGAITSSDGSTVYAERALTHMLNLENSLLILRRRITTFTAGTPVTIKARSKETFNGTGAQYAIDPVSWLRVIEEA